MELMKNSLRTELRIGMKLKEWPMHLQEWLGGIARPVLEILLEKQFGR